MEEKAKGGDDKMTGKVERKGKEGHLTFGVVKISLNLPRLKAYKMERRGEFSACSGASTESRC